MIALVNGGNSLNPEDNSNGDGRTPIREVFDAAIQATLKKEPQLDTILSAAKDAALSISQEYSLVCALIALAPLLKETERANTLDAVFKTTSIITDHEERARALTLLVPLLKARERETALTGAFEAAMEISCGSARVKALAALIPLLNGAERTTAMQVAFETAMSLSREDPESSSVVLDALVNFLAEPEREIALETLLQHYLEDHFQFSYAVTKYGLHLTPRLMSAVFETAMSISDFRVRASILTKLAALIAGNHPEYIALVQVDARLSEPGQEENQPRPHVMAAYQASHERFSSLYKKLAE